MLFIKDGFLDGRELLNNMMNKTKKSVEAVSRWARCIYIIILLFTTTCPFIVLGQLGTKSILFIMLPNNPS